MESTEEGNATTSNITTVCEIFDSKDYAYVAIASATAAFLSLVAASFVIVIMLLLRKWPYFSQRLILYLAIATILTSISTILHRVDYNNQTTSFYVISCQIGGFLEQITSWMFLNANTCITFYLFANVVLRKKTERLEVLYVLYIFASPFLLNWIPFIQDSFGRSGAWCWIRSKVDSPLCPAYIFGEVLIFTLWFVPLYLILFAIIITYFIIGYKLYKTSKEWTGSNVSQTDSFQKTVRNDVAPLFIYPLIYLGLSFFPTVNRVQGLVNSNQPILALWYLSALSFPLQGGIIAVAYTLDPTTRKRLKWSHIKAKMKGALDKSQIPQEYPVEVVIDQSFNSGYKQRDE